jgi:hypothetical protein
MNTVHNLTTIDEYGKKIPYQKRIHGNYNPLTGKFDLPIGGYKYPVIPSKDALGNDVIHPYPNVREMKLLNAKPNSKVNRKGRTFIQVIKDQFGNFVKNIFHFPKSIGMYK